MDLPPPLRRFGGYRIEPVGEGGSRARVFRLRKSGAKGLILKVQRVEEDPDPAARLAREAEASRWLARFGLGPRVEAYLAQGGYEYLLLEELPGLPASEVPPEARKEAVALLAQVLRRLHALLLEACPLDGRLSLRLEQARRRLELGLVDEEDFDEERRGRKAKDLFRELLRTRPEREDLVVAHGDYTLSNVLLGEGGAVGLVDLGRLGVADRYQDLALMVRSLRAWGEGWAEAFLRAYGLPEPDWAKLAFYQLLDEFF